METVPKTEIRQRIRRFQNELAAIDLQGAFILQNADIFYFTGTIQSSVLFIPSQGQPILMVQKNLQRARQESPLKEIVPIKNKNQIPVISPYFDAVLEEGMILALEPKFVFPKKGVVGLEDDYLVTSNGAKRLAQTDQVLIQIEF